MPPCPAPDASWLYLIRHGATANNRARPPRLQGRRTDPGLSPEGHEQARAAAEFFQSVRLDAVYSSPLARARETAQAIAQPHGLTVEIVDELVEVDVGLWEGLTWPEIEAKNPDAYRAFMSDGSVNPYLGGETITAVLERSAPALERLMAANPGKTIAAVAHNMVNRAWLSKLLGVQLAAYRGIPQDNCGINLLRCKKDKIKAVTVNSVFHLWRS